MKFSKLESIIDEVRNEKMEGISARYQKSYKLLKEEKGISELEGS